MPAQALRRVILPAIAAGALRGITARVGRILGKAPRRPGARRVPPIDMPLLLSPSGSLFVPHPFLPNAFADRPLQHGLAMSWTPVPELGGIILHFTGGNDAEPSSEMIVTRISSADLSRLIDDLQSIQRQLGGSHHG